MSKKHTQTETTPRKKKTGLIILIIVLALLLLLIAAAVIIVNHFLNKIDRIGEETPQIAPGSEFFETDFDDGRTLEEYTRDMSRVDVNKNGFFRENGHIFYYEKGIPTYSGLIRRDGAYYYINSDGMVVTGAFYCTKTNGLMGEGFYMFDKDGRMVIEGETLRDDQTLPVETSRATDPICGNQHDWVEDTSRSRASNCRDEGLTVWVCRVCGSEVSEPQPKLTGHTWDDGKITKAATCAKEGEGIFTCTVCGVSETRVIDKLPEHTYGTTWTADKNGHRYECTVCGEKLNEAAHTPGPAATIRTPQICTVCGYEINPALPHTHTLTQAWSYDETSHWRVCLECDETVSAAAHDYDNACDPTCNTCGFTRSVTHTMSEEPAFDGSAHWNVCDVCGAVSGRTSHVFDNDCDPTCNGCRYIRTTVHVMSEVWSSDEDAHWRVCSVCGASSDHTAHVYSNDCDPSCNICGHMRQAGHTLGTQWQYSTSDHWHSCTACGERSAPEAHVFDNSCDTTCNICGYVRTITHTMSTEWSSDGTVHWHECTVCGMQFDQMAHTPGPAATEAAPQTCTVCGYVIAPKLDHVHVWSRDWTADASGHRIVCRGCSESKDFAPHAYDNTCDTDCNICGYVRTITHTPSAVWSSDETRHWHVCTVCGATPDKTAHVFDNACDPTCNVCGYTRAIKHVIGTVWRAGTTTHWHACTVCGMRFDETAHTYDSICDITCDECGYVRQVTHVPDTVWSTNETTHWHICTVCGAAANKSAHVFDNACDTDCNICGYTRTTKHTVATVWSANGTTHWHACTSCGARFDEKAHTYDNVCDTTCNVCGYTRTVTHTPGKSWKSNEASHWHVCTVCGKQTDTHAHVYDNGCDTTCNVCGYTRKATHVMKTTWSSDASGHWHVCAVCGATDKKAAHKPGDPATAVKSQTCTVCGYVLKSATGHYEADSTGHWSVGNGKPGSGDFAVHLYNALDLCTVCGFRRPLIEEDKPVIPPDLPEIPSTKELYNILLIGTDNSTAETGQGNSDSMMLVSINLKTGQINVISFLRDLYVSIPGGYSDNRINAAYRFGGATLLKETIIYNFNINIDATVTVDFNAFKDIIDVLGGVTVNLSVREVEALNKSLKDSEKLKAGANLLDGKRALQYARLRSIDTDFERTNRQRTVINAIFNKFKQQSMTDLLRVMNTVLPYISTDLSNGEMIAVLTKIAPKLSKITLQTYSIPARSNVNEYKNTIVNQMMVLVPDMNALREKLFNQYLPYSR